MASKHYGERPNIRAVDLFCGAGGMTHGLIRSGIDVVAGFDLDPNCRYPYESNNSADFVEADIKEIRAQDITRILSGADFSLLAGCPPCQPFSTYSRSTRSRSNADDWKLVMTFGEVARQVQPDFVVMENVPQLARHEVFEQFLSSLDGYEVAWEIVDAVNWGVPQRRKRLVVLATKVGGSPIELRRGEGGPVTVREAISGLKPIEAGGRDLDDPLHSAPNLSKRNLERIKHSRPGGTWRDWPSELQSSCHRKVSGATYPSVYGRMLWDSPSPTITTQCFGYGNGRFGHPIQNRAISLREAALLQTFPHDYKFVEPEGRVRFNVLGRLIGNAVPVRLAEAIGKSVKSHISHL